mmetsp:Transcript_5772/g.16422  ORF Transcript_5772/g.16422 Transcript_5772/m.16422 type:complete len:215 (+) Transcript_5772:1813-2457(+)
MLVVRHEVRLDHTGDHGDRCDGTLLREPVRGHHLLAELGHQVPGIRQERLAVQVLGEVHERRTRVRGHLHDRVVHRAQQRGEYDLVVLLLQVGRVVRGGLADRVQRRVAHAGVLVAEQRHQELHDLVDVRLLLHRLRALREGHDRDVLVLPVAVVDELAHVREDVPEHDLRPEGLREAVDVLRAYFIVGDVDAARVLDRGPVLLVLQLQHELHA